MRYVFAARQAAADEYEICGVYGGEDEDLLLSPNDPVSIIRAKRDGGELTDDGRQLLNDMFSGTVYGKGKTMAEKVDEHGGKGRYILSRLFPKVSIMKNTYPVLEKCPVLLPFYYLVRLFSRLRHRKKEIRSEVRPLKNSKGDRP